MTGQLKDVEIRNILSSQVLGRLACTDGNQPYIVPLTFTYNGDYIYGQTNEGMKLQFLRKNPLVCFETDTMTDMANWQSVLVFGVFEELQGEEADKAKKMLFNRIFSLMTSRKIHCHEHEEVGKVDDSNREKKILFRIRIQKITGRYERG